ncbi:hypothetical protein [Streptomyces griseoruber]|uniref:Uncharacterized protein n=1 Tax=Streptomyces griseoruber TaxID=1943 RepID=A0A117RFM3_9ACTN|nr:hypothetical protein [Streptomyces griseoruber]KUN88108.1 hypothetical protein AQJ64_03970 [Streptomyces griseoruber]
MAGIVLMPDERAQRLRREQERRGDTDEHEQRGVEAVMPMNKADPPYGKDEEVWPYRLHLLAGASVSRGVDVTSRASCGHLRWRGAADEKES